MEGGLYKDLGNQTSRWPYSPFRADPPSEVGLYRVGKLGLLYFFASLALFTLLFVILHHYLNLWYSGRRTVTAVATVLSFCFTAMSMHANGTRNLIHQGMASPPFP